MEALKTKNNVQLVVKAVTWYKDSHALFDYESTKITTSNFNFPVKEKNLTFFRKRDCKLFKLSYSTSNHRQITR